MADDTVFDEAEAEEKKIPTENLTFVQLVKKKVLDAGKRGPIKRLDDQSKLRSVNIAFRTTKQTEERIYKLLDKRFDQGKTKNLTDLMEQMFKYIEKDEWGDF